MYRTLPPQEEMSQQLKARIKCLNISYEELSIQTAIPIATLNRLLKNPYNAKFSNIVKIFNELGISLCVE